MEANYCPRKICTSDPKEDSYGNKHKMLLMVGNKPECPLVKKQMTENLAHTVSTY